MPDSLNGPNGIIDNEGISYMIRQQMSISQKAGGFGLYGGNIRGADSYIAGTDGITSSVLKLMRVVEASTAYVDQGGSKRPGATAVYFEPWHSDIFDVLESQRKAKNIGDGTVLANLFYGWWIPDLFMERIRDDGPWTLMSPDECPGLELVHGEEFNKLYIQYEDEGRGRKIIRARDLWNYMITVKIENGIPYIMFKDHVNNKSNHKHLGTIKCSNLCTEITLYHDIKTMACCILNSISLGHFVKEYKECVDNGLPDNEGNIKSKVITTPYYDYYAHAEVVRQAVINLEESIDINMYPCPEAERGAKSQRALGIGWCGLADAFHKMKLGFEGEDSIELATRIAQWHYYAALDQSCKLAVKKGACEAHAGSPMSDGKFQFDLWGIKPEVWSVTIGSRVFNSPDWEELRERILRYGVRHSMLIAMMPTAGTAHINRSSETCMPYASGIYAREVSSGKYLSFNPHLMKYLQEHNLWTKDIIDSIIADNGSVRSIGDIPENIRNQFKTVWEYSIKTTLRLARAIGPYVDQAMSTNLYINDADPEKLKKALFHAWELGLKTGCYYAHSRAAREAPKVGYIMKDSNINNEDIKEGCVDACGS